MILFLLGLYIFGAKDTLQALIFSLCQVDLEIFFLQLLLKESISKANELGISQCKLTLLLFTIQFLERKAPILKICCYINIFSGKGINPSVMTLLIIWEYYNCSSESSTYNDHIQLRKKVPVYNTVIYLLQYFCDFVDQKGHNISLMARAFFIPL